jgi:hypothetical protein
VRGCAHVLNRLGRAAAALTVAVVCDATTLLADEPNAVSTDHVDSAAAKDSAASSSCARLSVLNGGEKRGEANEAPTAAKPAPFSRTDLNDGVWLFLVDEEDDAELDGASEKKDDADDGEDDEVLVAERFRLGHLSDRARPLAGDFDGDGDAEFVLFLDGEWFIDYNGNGQWDQDDMYIRLGDKDDQPVVGDWDGDGKDDVGVFGPNDSQNEKNKNQATAGLPDAENKQASESKADRTKLRSADDKTALPNRVLQKTAGGNVQSGAVDYVLVFDGRRGVPLAGDFNGDGVDTLAVFDDGRWFVDVDGDGRLSDADFTAEFGKAGDLPFVADFDGDGIDQIGIFRDGVWFVDSNGNRRLDDEDVTFKLGAAGDRPAPADLFGNGKDVAATYRPRATDEPSTTAEKKAEAAESSSAQKSAE